MLAARRVLCRCAACTIALGASACSLLLPLDQLAEGETATASVAQGSGGAGAGGAGIGGAVSSGGAASGSSGGMIGGAPSTYAAAVLSDAPVAYWRLGEAELPVAVDASGNGLDCTYSNGVVLGAPGVVPRDTAASFDGRTGFANCGVVMPFVSGAPFSIEAWILAEGDRSGLYRRIVSAEYQSSKDSTRQGLALWAQFTTQGGASLGFEIWRDQVQVCDVEYFPVTPDVLHHVVVVHDGYDAIVYIDAEARPMTCDGQTVADGETSWVLGRQSDGQYGYWRGTLDEIAIYASALSSDQVSAHFGAGRP
jgi:hypothetical protein